MKKIGIMGGTFNPIHYGHLLLAEYAYEEYELDEVWIMPTKNPGYRTISNSVSEVDRCNMIQLAIASNPHLQFSDLELKREGTTYTVDTLEECNSIYSDDEFYFIMGADSIFQFESWKSPDRILELCHVIVAQRGEQTNNEIERQIAYLCNKYTANIHLLHSPNLDISSHGIRKRVRLGQTFKYLLPESVEAYILEHKLYI